MNTSKKTTTRTAARGLFLALTLGILMSACTTPAPGSGQTSSLGVKNPHEALDGRRVSPSRGLKDAATDAYDLHRGILEQVGLNSLDGDVSADINRRSSSETPAYKDGNSYWNLGTLSYLNNDVDTNAVFRRVKAYLETQGYTAPKVEVTGTPPELMTTAQFGKNSSVSVIDITVRRNTKIALIGITIVTADFPNPPESEWPASGEEETWKPSVPLWPAGLGPKETASPTP